MTYLVFTSPALLSCQYLKKTWMFYGQIWSQWSLNETISYLCKLSIQDGCQGLLLKIAWTQKWQYLKNCQLKLIQLCARIFLVWSHFDFLNGTISNLCKLTMKDGRWAVTKNCINTKMTIPQEPLVKKIIQLCARMFLVWSHFDFCNLAFQDGGHL